MANSIQLPAYEDTEPGLDLSDVDVHSVTAIQMRTRVSGKQWPACSAAIEKMNGDHPVIKGTSMTDEVRDGLNKRAKKRDAPTLSDRVLCGTRNYRASTQVHSQWGEHQSLWAKPCSRHWTTREHCGTQWTSHGSLLRQRHLLGRHSARPSRPTTVR